MAKKRIGVITSGGDAPGMNAAIRTVVRTALSRGAEVIGIERGYYGLIHGEFSPLTSRSVADIIHRGGTILKSARSEQFKRPEGYEKAAANLREAGIEALVVIGGDGSFRGARLLTDIGFPAVGVPATIDNDISCTDVSIGFDTAVNTVVEGMNKIRDTATSHERVYVVEVMGRNSGFIALWAGLAGGAESILIPEIPVDLDLVCEKIVHSYNLGKSHSIIVAAEGCFGDPHASSVVESAGFRIARHVREATQLEVRVTVLGHLQRGGTPTAADRILASRLAYAAVELALDGVGGRMVGIVNGAIQSFAIEDAIRERKGVDPAYYALAETLSSL